MDSAVADICVQLTRSKLLPSEEVTALQERWRAEAKGAAGDLRRFRRWLVDRKILTRCQAKLVFHGHAEHCFLGPYKLLDRVARGAMAGIYKAVHPDGRVVAIKVLPPSKAHDAQALARFRREAQLAERLNHPNVVRTFETGEAHGLHYLVMEYLEGETLLSVLDRRGRLPAAKAGRILLQALLGLQYLHEQGMVHRDLEPGNLMLVPAAKGRKSVGRATVKLLDVGLARALNDNDTAADDRVVSTEGDLLGNPAYMAPEHVLNFHGADIRADLYSLGCIFFHALTGRPPFADTSLRRHILRHANEPPKPLKEMGVEAPAGMQAVLDQMLAKSPSQRFATPKQAADALRQVLGDKPRVSKPARSKLAPRLDEFRKWLETDEGDRLDPPPAPAQAVEQRPVATPARQETAAGFLPATTRECLFVIAGGIGVLLAEVGFWVLLRLLRGP